LSAGSGQPFSVLLARRVPAREVHIRWEKGPALPARVERVVKERWQGAPQARHGDQLFDGEIAGLASWELTDDGLALHLFPMRYRYVWYLYTATREGADSEITEQLPRALGTSAVVRRGDAILLMRRSDWVAEFPGRLDVFGGHIERDTAGSWLGPVESIVRELVEELGCAAEALVVPYCLGLVQVRATGKPELVFYAEVDRRARLQLNEESRGTVEVPVSEVARFLRRSLDRLTPAAAGSLWLWLQSN